MSRLLLGRPLHFDSQEQPLNYLCHACIILFLGTVLPTMLEEEESVNAVRQLTEQFDEVRRKKQTL